MAKSDSTEQWRSVVGYEHQYEVSNHGRVRHISGVLLSQSKTSNGYWQVRLSQPRLMARVHRLVAKAFLPAVVGKPSVNHIDCDGFNNRVGNLEWCSQRENLAHMTRLGRRGKPQLGKRSFYAKLSDDQVRHIRSRRSEGFSLAAIAAEFGINKKTVLNITKGRTYADVR